jgi:chromosome segregation ATPase
LSQSTDTSSLISITSMEHPARSNAFLVIADAKTLLEALASTTPKCELLCESLAAGELCPTAGMVESVQAEIMRSKEAKTAKEFLRKIMKQRDEFKNEANDFHRAYHQQEHEIEHLKDQIKALNAKIHNYREQAGAKDQANLRKREALKAKQWSLSLSEKSNARLRELNNDLRDERRSLLTHGLTSKELDQMNTRLKLEINGLNENAYASRNEIKRLRDENARLQEANAVLRAEKASSMDHIETIRRLFLEIAPDGAYAALV